MGTTRLTLPARLEAIEEGPLLHATVEFPGRARVTVAKAPLHGRDTGPAAAHWLIVLPPAPR
jgi:hypothetical protein